MTGYIVRRILQMIPTVFGVVLITFILFNVVGGSPAAMTLGQHVSPRALEDFDEIRGFNKPLLFGLYAKTRAYSDTDFETSPGLWKGQEGAQVIAGALVLCSGDHAQPLAFVPPPGTRWRWRLTYTLDGEEATTLHWGDAQQVIPPSTKRKRLDLDFTIPAEGELTWTVPDSGLRIYSLSLRRRMAHPFDSQLIFYLNRLVHLDFGTSNISNQRVSRMLIEGAGPSLMLTVPIFLSGLVTAISLSLICAYFRNRWIDRLLVFVSVALMSINYLVFIVGGQYLFSYRLGWFPVWGFEGPEYLVLPILIGTISGLGGGVRFYRTIMLDELYKDYVRTAVAKGTSKVRVLFVHVLKNAMVPIVTNVVIAIPFLYTGSLLLESFFGIPGLGRMGVEAINSSDVDVVRALVFIGAVLYVVANLVTDLVYVLVDPRVKLK